MSPHRAPLPAAPARELELLPASHEYAILDELSFVRREAQLEADLAYADWSQRPADRLAFAVYRAAQDRADAAQDDLGRLAYELLELEHLTA